MSKKTSIILSIILFLGLGAGAFFLYRSIGKKEFTCINGETAIYEYYKNAVVLVKHKFSYKISVKHCEPFILHVDESDLTGNEITGTGFFVSKDGKIVTNRHVVQPWTSMPYDPTSNLKSHIASILPDSVAVADIPAYLEKNWGKYFEEDGEDIATADTSKHNTTDTTKVTIGPPVDTPPSDTVKTVQMVREEDIEIIPVSDEISVALHGSIDEWLPCKIVTYADEEGVDIGVLQLKSETLPIAVTHVVDMDNAITDEGILKPGNKAILIGYPMGTELASTKKGILVQAYEGQINKESDGVSLQYNVTSTHGASGSPVFNECGQLIAVNYAGFDRTQGYNFGIIARYAKKLVR